MNPVSGELGTHPEGVSSQIPEWRGTARYDVLRPIGQGGMGVVYEANDRERGQHVALKTLLRFNPATLYLFKQEFRTLADVQHPNLVRLYELVVTETDGAFFTMELVNGTDFLTYVHHRPYTESSGSIPNVPSIDLTRPDKLDSSSIPSPRPDKPPVSGKGPRATPRASPSGRVCAADMDRLRPALRQLVEGIDALHSAGKLHRDIKPSNVRVTTEGRVVLLDFGVATELPRVVDESLGEDGAVVGTARYMAPEQATGEAPTPACDWYSVGVVLYEALVGSPPFTGSAFDVLTMKSMLDPSSPAECAEGVPADLDELCRALLHREPHERPNGEEILRRLGVSRPARGAVVSTPVAPESDVPALIGREPQAAALQAAFGSTRAGASVTVRIAGVSGMGKSTLVQHVLDELVGRGDAVVLRARAYERESLPYKAVDGVIDALSRYLMRLGERNEMPTPLPEDTWALARLFPVLRRVPEIRDLADQPVVDPQSVRRRAFIALRQLLLSLSRRQPLAVFIDDMQWGDTDSAALLLELMRPPQAPSILLIMTHREEEAEASSCLNEIYGRWPEGADVRDLHVGPLDPIDANRLASTLLQADASASQDLPFDRDSTAAVVARESGGNPFLIEELVRGVAAARGATPASADQDASAMATVGLDQMIRDRLARLPDDARTLVEVIAVSGRPLPVAQVAEAAGISAADEAIALLRARRFVRTGLREGHEVAEAIHDRIRETIVAQLPASVVVDHHRRLAQVLEAAPVRDAEALAIHLLGAGEKARAAEYAERAADHASAKLAFDQAVRLLRVTLECTPPASPDARRLRMRIAEVLEWAGRSAEAALVYFDAAKGAPTFERLDLERSSAEQLLACGRIDEGIDVLYRVLGSVGLRPPKSVLGALVWIILYRVLSGLFRPRVRIRSSDGVSPVDRVRIDALYSLALGISTVDVVRGSALQARHLHLALRAGDRFRVLRAMVIESTQLAGIGGPVGKREAWLMDEASKLAGDDDNSEGMVFLRGASGVGHFLRGRWRKASEVLDLAYAKFPYHRAGWHSNAHLFRVQALYFAGEIAELARRGPQLLADAEQRGDLYMAVNLRTRAVAGVCLARDEPEDARRQIHESLAQWSHSGFLVQHWQAMIYEVEIDLYLGDGPRAYARLQRDLPALRRSFLPSLQVIRVLTTFARGRCAVARIEAEPGRRRALLAEARRALRSLRREGLPWTESLAVMLAAMIANASGDRDATLDFLRRAVELADRADMGLHVAATRYRLGEVAGGAEGEAALRQAEEAMAKEGVRSPPRTAARLLPGRWDQSRSEPPAISA